MVISCYFLKKKFYHQRNLNLLKDIEPLKVLEIMNLNELYI